MHQGGLGALAYLAYFLYFAGFCEVFIRNGVETGKTQSVVVDKLGTLIQLHIDEAGTLFKCMIPITEKAFRNNHLALCCKAFQARRTVFLVNILGVRWIRC